MRVESVTILHYGRDYLPWALRSVYDQVDRAVVVYSPHPTHGTTVKEPCPETEDELRRAALSVGPKVKWERVTAYWKEGDHRDYAYSLCREADVMLVLDADEVWDPNVLEGAIKQVWDGSANIWRLRFTTPWRSFSYVCHDDMLPERFRDNRPGRSLTHDTINKDLGDIWHFGYCVKDVIMRYKWKCHGHITELRPNWFEEKWSPWPPVQDVHPTCVGFWNPEPMDKNLLPELMRDHPFWDVEPIR